MNTKFLSPIDLYRLIERIREGDEEAESMIINEYDRLQNRVKNLELGMEIAVSKFNTNNNSEPVL